MSRPDPTRVASPRPASARSSLSSLGSAPLQRGATAAYRVLSVVTLLCIAAQFFLAGLGVFSRQDHHTADGYLQPHAVLGTAIGVLTLLLALAASTSRAGRTAVVLALLLFALAGAGEPVLAALGGSSPWFGGLHALCGGVIAGLAGTLVARTRRPRSTLNGP